MRVYLMFIVSVLLSASAISQESSAKVARIKKLMEVTGSGELGVQVVQNIITTYKQSYTKVDTTFWNEISAEISPAVLIDLIIPIYDKYFTLEDINQMIAFYDTPIGKKVIKT